MEVRTDILALDDSVSNGTTEALTSLLLVTVVASTIKETVTRLESLVDGLHDDASGWSRPGRNRRLSLLTSAQVALVT